MEPLKVVNPEKINQRETEKEEKVQVVITKYNTLADLSNRNPLLMDLEVGDQGAVMVGFCKNPLPSLQRVIVISPSVNEDADAIMRAVLSTCI